MIIVFGAIHMDVSIGLDALPQAGETVLAENYMITPGGKGANQALAAVRYGARVALVGKVGADDMGSKATTTLRRAGVMTTGVAKSDEPTGIAFVMRGSRGQKRVIVCPGANLEASEDQVPEEVLGEANYLLMQMEVPVERNIALLEKAKAHGATTLLNLAPVTRMTRRILDNLDYLIVNRVEARQIAENMGLTMGDDAPRMARILSDEGQLTCIITRGPDGSVAATPQGQIWQVDALGLSEEEEVDVTGSGDAYCGTLAACLESGMDLAHAMQRASVTASLACTRLGAQSALPYHDDVEQRLSEIAPAYLIED